ncbi:MAG: DUF6600 domain-containing protein [Terriglobales bacterium]
MKRIVLVVLAVLVTAAMLVSQDGAQGSTQTAAPPQSNALVARLSLISGSVSTQRGDTGDWTAGALNTPIVTGDKVAAGANSRAEIELDFADVLRLGDNAQANFVSLTQNQIQLQLASGLADYVVEKDTQASSEIDTPNISVRPRGAGVFRILIPNDSETIVIVRKGAADVSTPQGSTTLQQGQQITVQGTDAPEYKIADAPAQDAWDQWNNTRDNTERESASLSHTNPYYTGVQDLDNYGDWTVVPGYGQVWVPTQNAGWSPYSDGRWLWEPGWGWTWVDYEPWGWAPYHYGRWFTYGADWVWWPGPISPWYRPIWAPAYVSFFGWGGGVGVGWGRIGWLPVGPCDPYRPWWGGRRFSHVNINVITVNNIYIRNGRVVAPLSPVRRGRTTYSNLLAVRTNARVRAAIIRVPTNEFGHGAIGGREHVSTVELRRGSVLGGQLPVAPTRQSLTVGARVTNPTRLPHNVATHFFGTRGTLEARPTFNQEQSRVESRIGASATIRAHGQAPAARVATENSLAAARDRNPRAVGAPAPRANAPAASRAPASGWSRFGQPAPSHSVAPHVVRPAPERPAATPHAFTPSAPRPQPAAPAGGWQRFRPQPADHGVVRGGGEPSYSAPTMRGEPSYSAPTMRGEPSYRAPSYEAPRRSEPAYRPPLSMSHPIVQAPRAPAYRPPAHIEAPRSGGYSGGGASHESHAAPSHASHGGGPGHPHH